MAYTPTVWETGDVITAAKLNKAEQGIAGNCPIVIEAGDWTNDPEEGWICEVCSVADFKSYILTGRNILISFKALATENVDAFVGKYYGSFDNFGEIGLDLDALTLPIGGSISSVHLMNVHTGDTMIYGTITFEANP